MKACYIILVAIASLGLAELGARYGLGLGDPPLSIPDAEIDYLFAPNQDCNRFGNRIVYNLNKSGQRKLYQLLRTL